MKTNWKILGDRNSFLKVFSHQRTQTFILNDKLSLLEILILKQVVNIYKKMVGGPQKKMYGS